MKKVLIFPFAVLFLLLFCVPALADAQLDLNGRDYNTNSGIILRDGVSFATADTIKGVLGCDAVVEADTVTLQENDETLTFKIGSDIAFMNGGEKQMPAAPFLAEDQVFLPIRFIAESLGAEVSWNDLNRTVAINYVETRDGLTAEELITKSSEKMTEANSYKMKLDMDMNMGMSGSENGTPIEAVEMSSKSNSECWFQHEPLAMYMIQNVNIPESSETPATEAQTEMLFTDNAMYMTIPGHAGWLKMDLAGLGDFQELLNQLMSMDPTTTMKLMNEMGVFNALANDQELDGQKYWVVNTVMGKELLQSDYFKQIMQSITALSNEEIDLASIIDGIDFTVSSSSWINQATLLTDFMDMSGTISINMNLPGQDIPAVMNMNMDIDGKCVISDYGIAFELPDVSEAIDFETFMAEAVEELEPVE